MADLILFYHINRMITKTPKEINTYGIFDFLRYIGYNIGILSKEDVYAKHARNY